MTHTSTIIKVSGNTNFNLDKLRTDTGGQDVFSLAIGKVRTVAGKASRQGPVPDQDAVGGLRRARLGHRHRDPGRGRRQATTLEGTGWIQNLRGAGAGRGAGIRRRHRRARFQGVPDSRGRPPGPAERHEVHQAGRERDHGVNKAYQATLQQAAPGTQGPPRRTRPLRPRRRRTPRWTTS